MNQIDAYCIFLENNLYSQQKLKQAIESGDQYGWKIIPFPGTIGDQINWIKEKLIPSPDSKFQRRKGAQGCFMSHYRLWNLCVELNKPIAIFEHDVIFQSGPENFDVSVDVLKLNKLTKIRDDEFTGDWEVGAHAYIVTPVGAEKMIKWSKEKFAYHADMVIGSRVVNWKCIDKDIVKISEDNISTTRFKSFKNV